MRFNISSLLGLKMYNGTFIYLLSINYNNWYDPLSVSDISSVATI
jgi:hypothetical protein